MPAKAKHSTRTPVKATIQKPSARSIRFSTRVGFWTSVALSVLGVAYAAGLILVMTVFPLPAWTDAAGFAQIINTTPETVFLFMQSVAFIALPLFVVFLAAIHDIAPESKKILTRTGLAFGIIFATLSSINYYVQWAVVRPQMLAGNFAGLDLFAQWNTSSVMFAINMLGYFFYQGLSTLVVAPIFVGSRLEDWMRWVFILNGINGIMGGLALVINAPALLIPSLMLLTVLLTAVPVLSAVLFRRLMRA